MNPSPMRIQYELTRHDLFLAQCRTRLLSPGAQIAYWLSVGFLFELFVKTDGWPKALVFALIMALAVPLIEGVFYWLQAYTGVHRGSVGRHLIEIREEGFWEETDFNRSLFSWNCILRCVARSGFVLVYETSMSAHLIPNRAFESPVQREAFLAAVRGLIRPKTASSSLPPVDSPDAGSHELRLEYTVSRYDFFRFLATNAIAKPLNQTIAGATFACAVLVELRYLNLPEALSFAVCGLLVLLLLLVVVALLQSIRADLRRFSTRHILEIRDDGLWDETEFNRSLYDWRSIEQCQERPGLVAVSISDTFGPFVPNRTFRSGEQRQKFVAAIRAHRTPVEPEPADTFPHSGALSLASVVTLLCIFAAAISVFGFACLWAALFRNGTSLGDSPLRWLGIVAVAFFPICFVTGLHQRRTRFGNVGALLFGCLLSAVLGALYGYVITADVFADAFDVPDLEQADLAWLMVLTNTIVFFLEAAIKYRKTFTLPTWIVTAVSLSQTFIWFWNQEAGTHKWPFLRDLFGFRPPFVFLAAILVAVAIVVVVRRKFLGGHFTPMWRAIVFLSLLMFLDIAVMHSGASKSFVGTFMGGGNGAALLVAALALFFTRHRDKNRTPDLRSTDELVSIFPPLLVVCCASFYSNSGEALAILILGLAAAALVFLHLRDRYGLFVRQTGRRTLRRSVFAGGAMVLCALLAGYTATAGVSTAIVCTAEFAGLPLSDRVQLYLYMHDTYFWRDRLSWKYETELPLDQWFHAMTDAAQDRWSRIAAARPSGNSAESFGFFVDTWHDHQIYVKTVHPYSPADDAGVDRGMRVLRIGDLVIPPAGLDAKGNSRMKELFDTDELDIDLAEGKDPPKSYSLRRATYNSSMIYHSEVIPDDNGPIGYFVYKGFNLKGRKAVLRALGRFHDAGIRELVLDLRYNYGGSLVMMHEIASAIAGKANVGNIMMRSRHGDDREGLNEEWRFFESPASLSLNRLFVLTGSETCSASENLINDLRPYMPVVVIGATTCGKPYATHSLRLTDWVANPVTYRVENAKNVSVPLTGIVPDCEGVDDFTHPFGDTSDPMLADAIHYIHHGTCKPSS